MNIDTRYEETKSERWFCNFVEIAMNILLIAFISVGVFGLAGCATQDTSVSNAANQCYPSGLQSYTYHGGTGSLQVVCK